MRQVGSLGTPVTCVSFLDNDTIIYGLGPFLWKESKASRKKREQVLVLQGENIHGVRHLKNLSVVFGGPCLSLVNHDTMTPLNTLNFRTDDWIFDVQWMDEHTILVGHAHNSIQFLRVEFEPQGATFRRLHTILGQTRSISYAIHIGRNDHVAVGTVTNDILIWKLHQDPSNKATPTETKLSGHKGVIHHVQWHKDRDMLVSASDDRSIRCWAKNEDEWSLLWSAYGHKARCWRAVFCESTVLSLGEDGYLRIWSIQHGDSLAAVMIQESLCLWSLDVYGSVVAMGTHSGTVAFIDWKSELQSSARQIFKVPDDRLAPPTEASPTDGTDLVTKKKRKKIKKQVLVGSALYQNQNGRTRVIVSTRMGSLTELDLESGAWTQCLPWNILQDSRVDPKLGTCMSLNPHKQGVVAIGCHNGNTIVQWNFSSSTRQSCVLNGITNRSIQKLAWMDASTLLVFHVATVCVWSFQYSQDTSPQFVASCHITGALAISFAYLVSHSLLAIGDTRGRVSLFRLPKSYDSGPCDLQPSSIAHRVHGREHVNDLYFIRCDYLLSVGNDGSVSFLLCEGDNLTVANSMPLPSFTACCQIWENKERQEIIIGGYCGNIYRLLSLNSLSDVCAGIDTEGRARTTNVALDLEVETLTLIVHVQLSDGSFDLLYSKKSLQNMLGYRLHKETIFGSCAFPVKDNLTGLVTVSEDCYARLTYMYKDQVRFGFAFGHIDSGARAVACCASNSRRYGSGTFVAIGGGKETVKFYFIGDEIGDMSMPVTILLGYYSKGGQNGQRVNCLDIRYHSSGLAVVSGNSAGQISLCWLNVEDTKQVIAPQLITTMSSSVVSLLLLEEHKLLAGSTSGKLLTLDYFADETDVSSNHQTHAVRCEAIRETHPHGGGLNSLIVTENMIFTVGDDQHIMKRDTTTTDTIHFFQTHSSIRGVCLTGELIVCADYAQCVDIFDRNGDTALSTVTTEIGDINTICSNGKYVFVGGIGLAIIDLDH